MVDTVFADARAEYGGIGTVVGEQIDQCEF